MDQIGKIGSNCNGSNWKNGLNCNNGSNWKSESS